MLKLTPGATLAGRFTFEGSEMPPLHQSRRRPNCYVEIFGHHIWIMASRDIEAGEELTYD